MSRFVIGVVGNPNCGKTTLFNVLTGTKQRVGNWPGVTVDRKVGHFQYEHHQIELVDLPGIYSLDVIPQTSSVDEQIAQDYILSGAADLIVNIVDATNLERNLYLTTELLEMQVPLVVAINMMDRAQQRQIKVDLVALSQQLGVPVIPVTAAQNQGIDALQHAMIQAAQAHTVPSIRVTYPPAIEAAIEQLLPEVRQQLSPQRQAHAHWITLKLLENDGLAHQLVQPTLRSQVTAIQKSIETELQEELDTIVADNRYAFIFSVVEKTVHKSQQFSRTVSDKIDTIVLHRFGGPLIFLGVIYLMFMFTINMGNAFVDFFDILMGSLLVEGLGALLTQLHTPAWLTLLLADGIGGGIQTVATFIPIIGFLYLFLSFLEDSGYMARAAFIMDRFMRRIGLPGKSFVPLIVGFGCNVPAVMSTRILENPRDRMLTILMNPFISCGARLPVYALFAAAFFPIGGQNVVFGLYLIGIAVAILTGLIMKKTLLKGEVAHFFIELPAYHWPTWRNMGLQTWERLKRFIFGAGKIIVPMVVVLTFLNAWGTDGSYDNENSRDSVLSELSQTVTPVFEPMGINEDNWPAIVGILTGILAKEVVIGSLDALYSQLAMPKAVEPPFDFWSSIYQAFSSIPLNLAQLSHQWLDPLGINIGDISNLEMAASAQAVDEGTFGAMVERFDGRIGAFAYLLFILLYTPCSATIAAIYRETTLKWTLFVTAWTTGIAYLVATVFYQLATLNQHPLTSIAWSGGLLGLFGLTVLLLKYYGHVQPHHPLNYQPTPENYVKCKC